MQCIKVNRDQKPQEIEPVSIISNNDDDDERQWVREGMDAVRSVPVGNKTGNETLKWQKC